jgi:hypothetical protein
MIFQNKKPYNKYGNKKVIIDGFTFDSIKESNRYLELKLLLKAKKIHDLVLQPEYIIQSKFKVYGKTHREVKYIADFKYIQDSEVIVEDVKGFLTDIFKLKRKLFLYKYGNELTFREL